MFQLSSYQYDLPPELIAQRPCAPRDHSRLMVVDRKTGNISEIIFYDLIKILQKGDQIVFNDTKVMPARLLGTRAGGGLSEILLIRQNSVDSWEALVRPGRKLRKGSPIIFGSDFKCEVLDVLSDGIRLLKFYFQGNFFEHLKKYGITPLPPYINRENEKQDVESYQTVYAQHFGSSAAPTAGLHFTNRLLDEMDKKGVEMVTVTLHVGLGTFRPVQSEDIRQHEMHKEQFHIASDAEQKLNQEKRLRICVGTTTCRALETAAKLQGNISSGSYDTNIFIYPGYEFKYVTSLLTNFHLPGSSLLMLVSAFAGYELIREAYRKAVLEKYRFFSYGDAMLIL